MPHAYNKESNDADMAILGLSPGGLAAALQEALSRKQLIAFYYGSSYLCKACQLLHQWH